MKAFSIRMSKGWLVGRRSISATGRLLIKLSIQIWVAAFAAGSAFAAECPDSDTARDGFVLERPGIRSVVRPSGEEVTVVTNEFQSTLPQTQFFVGGLVEVFRNSEKGRFSVLPAFDLRGIFPLKKGKSLKIEWLRLDAIKNRVDPYSLSLELTGNESITLGACTYDVLAVRQIFSNAAGEATDSWTALYSADLQMVLAKRYDEGTSKEETIAFETIEALAE